MAQKVLVVQAIPIQELAVLAELEMVKLRKLVGQVVTLVLLGQVQPLMFLQEEGVEVGVGKELLLVRLGEGS